MKAATVAYQPISLLARIGGGMLAGMVFAKVWRLATHGEAPGVLDEDRGWGEALVAATLQGAVLGMVKGIINRGGATGVRGLTGEWPKG